MSQEALSIDDQSHYEVSLTAGQAFLAFVLLLLSLAASFAFGLLIGRGQGDDKLTARKDAAVVTEVAAPAKSSTRTADVTVHDDDFKQGEPAKISEEPVPAPRRPVVPVAAPGKRSQYRRPARPPAREDHGRAGGCRRSRSSLRSGPLDVRSEDGRGARGEADRRRIQLGVRRAHRQPEGHDLPRPGQVRVRSRGARRGSKAEDVLEGCVDYEVGLGPRSCSPRFCGRATSS